MLTPEAIKFCEEYFLQEFEKEMANGERESDSNVLLFATGRREAMGRIWTPRYTCSPTLMVQAVRCAASGLAHHLCHFCVDPNFSVPQLHIMMDPDRPWLLAVYAWCECE